MTSGSPRSMKLRPTKEAPQGDTCRSPETLPKLPTYPPTIGQRYQIEGEIARGGMGAVLRATDSDLRREIALKYLLNQSDAEKKLRFLEEAQITGQLEHPNIVPIHELGVDQNNRPFFTMKMVKGRSLAQVLDELGRNPAEAGQEWSLGRLLNVFVCACNALTYAHSRGVLHRDLKSANIMIGDFGEVYVMDWGVAKVLQQGSDAAAPAPPIAEVAPLPLPAPAVRQVVTSRAPQLHLTQDGAVVGTPVYMPPEQAAGKIAQLDQRSDVYSLGAILYEILTLQPPIANEGGYLNVILCVLEGAIVPPEQRHPQRAAAGHIPRELAAIALKALAKRPEDRYPSAEALRRDVERFQEGHSVSAKEDTFWESVCKLVKRNRAASKATALALAVLAIVVVIGFWAVNNARVRSQRANVKFLVEKEAKRLQALKSVPAYLRAAHLAVSEQAFADALVHVETALDYAPEHEEARLLKGQLLIVQRHFPAAAEELAKVVQQTPGRPGAAALLHLCQQTKSDDQAAQLAFAAAFTEQGAYALADGMLKQVGANAVLARKQLLEVYQKRIEAAWPGLGNRLSIDRQGRVALNLNYCPQVTDLVPLRGLPLSSLHLYQCNQLRDLTPLRGMPLTVLYLAGCPEVHDLTPLHGMPLTYLNLYRCTQVHDLAPLQNMPLTVLDISGCAVRDLAPLHGLPLTWLNLGDCSQVNDLTPLRGLPLTKLFLVNCPQVRDLSPLRGMSLTEVTLSPKTITRGLDVLRDMPTLTTVGTSWADDKLPADDFWKKLQSGRKD